MRYETSILDLIRTSKEHMTAEQVFLTLKQTHPSVVLATVYNNLNSLYEQGKIRKISMEGGPDRYDNVTRHDHLVCRRCGSLADVHLPDLTPELERQTGVCVEGYDLKIQYLCPKCRRELEAADSACESSDL